MNKILNYISDQFVFWNLEKISYGHLNLIDATDNRWHENYNTVRNEISKYGKKISSKKEIIVISKADLLNSDRENVIEQIKKIIDSELFIISSLNNEGIEELMDNLFKYKNIIDD